MRLNGCGEPTIRRGKRHRRASALDSAEGIIFMASRSIKDSSKDSSSHPHNPDIIEFVPRQRVRHCVLALLAALAPDADRAAARRMIAEARATFGDDLVAELQRTMERGTSEYALTAIVILLELATDAARAALWTLARDPAYHPALRLEALRGLYQQGADVPIGQLVELANQCERNPRPHDLDLP
jgi:hypothetical protein